MSYLMVRHTVKDYNQWKKEFDQTQSIREKYGLGKGQIFGSHDERNEVVVLLEIRDIHLAQEFMQSPERKQCMERGGVSDKPDIFYLDELTKVEAPAGAKVGATTKISYEGEG